jgi:hypothetical protein
MVGPERRVISRRKAPSEELFMFHIPQNGDREKSVFLCRINAMGYISGDVEETDRMRPVSWEYAGHHLLPVSPR